MEEFLFQSFLTFLIGIIILHLHQTVLEALLGCVCVWPKESIQVVVAWHLVLDND